MATVPNYIIIKILNFYLEAFSFKGDVYYKQIINIASVSRNWKDNIIKNLVKFKYKIKTEESLKKCMNMTLSQSFHFILREHWYLNSKEYKDDDFKSKVTKISTTTPRNQYPENLTKLVWKSNTIPTSLSTLDTLVHLSKLCLSIINLTQPQFNDFISSISNIPSLKSLKLSINIDPLSNPISIATLGDLKHKIKKLSLINFYRIQQQSLTNFFKDNLELESLYIEGFDDVSELLSLISLSRTLKLLSLTDIKVGLNTFINFLNQNTSLESIYVRHDFQDSDPEFPYKDVDNIVNCAIQLADQYPINNSSIKYYRHSNYRANSKIPMWALWKTQSKLEHISFSDHRDGELLETFKTYHMSNVTKLNYILFFKKNCENLKGLTDILELCAPKIIDYTIETSSHSTEQSTRDAVLKSIVDLIGKNLYIQRLRIISLLSFKIVNQIFELNHPNLYFFDCKTINLWDMKLVENSLLKNNILSEIKMVVSGVGNREPHREYVESCCNIINQNKKIRSFYLNHIPSNQEANRFTLKKSIELVNSTINSNIDHLFSLFLNGAKEFTESIKHINSMANK